MGYSGGEQKEHMDGKREERGSEREREGGREK